MKLAALVPVLGDARRQQARQRKPYQLLEGKTVLGHTLSRLERCQRIERVYLVVPPEDLEIVAGQVLSVEAYSKVQEVVPGGLLRQDSIQKALTRLEPGVDLVLIHDGSRPLVSADLLERVIAAAEVHGAAVAAVPVHDTIKTISKDNYVAASYDRRRLRSLQTPMVFRHDILARAFSLAARENFYGSDEAVLVERLGEKIKVVAGSQFNLYVATREDLALARAILRMEREAARGEGEGSPEGGW